jgi:hypothetical protein
MQKKIIKGTNSSKTGHICKCNLVPRAISREKDIMSRTRVVALDVPYPLNFKLLSYCLRV